jgi:WD40 repeat protein
LPIGPERSFVGFGFDPTGERVVTLTCAFDEEPSCDATLTVWDVSTEQPMAGPVDAGPVWFGLFDGAAFTGDGEFVVTAGYAGGVSLWDAATLTPVDATLSLEDIAPLPGAEVRALATGSRDGRSLLVATGEFNEAVVWDLTDGVVEPIGPIAGNISNVGITRDGHVVTAQGGGTFQLRDPFTLEPVGAPFVTDIPTFHFRQSSVGTLVSSSPWGAQNWDTATSQPLSGPLATLWAEIAPDGSTLYLGAFGEGALTGGAEVRAVELQESALVDVACERAGRNLSIEEWELYMPAGGPYRSTCPQWPAPPP